MITPLKDRTALFWDVNADQIECLLATNPEWVVVRVFEYGKMDDIYDVIDLYGESRVRQILEVSSLNRIAAAMAHIIFDIEKPQSKNAVQGKRYQL